MNELKLPDIVPAGETITRRHALAQITRMLGGGASLAALSGVAVGCEPEERSSTLAGRGAGSLLSARQREMLATIADHLIPPTDTPGARRAGVPEFIEIAFRESLHSALRDQFIAGLSDLDTRAQREHGRDYLDCTSEQQRALLLALDNEAFQPASSSDQRPRVAGDRHEPPRSDARQNSPAASSPPASSPSSAPAPEAIRWRWGEDRSPSWGATSFWRTLKRLVLVGYYTSELGATRELRYLALPGRYDGCTAIGRTWAV
ncbi:MAG TPA: gluconate 2-dehydrogenase subunit 3 family protein [Longimicrobiaceae bacterium]